MKIKYKHTWIKVGKEKRCSICNKKKPKNSKKKGNGFELKVGQKFGKYKVLSMTKLRTSSRGRIYRCQCKCGAIRNVRLSTLKKNKVGCNLCHKVFFKKHGHSVGYKVTNEYRSWSHLISRCTNINDKSFPRYGGRGIKVCNHWRKFKNFFQDMGTRLPGHSIERINVNKGYSRGNCKWIPMDQQSKNRATTIRFKFKGKEMCMADWARELEISPFTVYTRLRSGLTKKQALGL